MVDDSHYVLMSQFSQDFDFSQNMIIIPKYLCLVEHSNKILLITRFAGASVDCGIASLMHRCTHIVLVPRLLIAMVTNGWSLRCTISWFTAVQEKVR